MYRPLNSSANEIRLSVIRGGKTNEDIYCTLQPVSLDRQPSYEALSYVCGDPENVATIYVQGEARRVTVNLALALRQLRKEDSSRIIWADAICINQNDLTERQDQVSRMADIYKNAAAVVAWVGEPTLSTGIAMNAIEAMGADPQIHWQKGNDPCLDSSMLDQAHIHAVSSFLDRTWWHRLWTVQESIVPQNLSFLCGSRELSADTLFAAVINFFQHSTTCCFRLTDVESGMISTGLTPCFSKVMMLHKYRSVVHRLNFFELISTYRERQCSDPRDKIYALLGLLSPIHAGLIPPDYTKSTEEVFEEATLQLLHRTNNFQVWCLLFPPAVSLFDSAGTNLPSWVPDWNAKASAENFRDLHIRMSQYGLYSAAHEWKTSTKYIGRGHLQTHAKIIGTIAELGEARDSGEGYLHNQVYKNWRQLAQVDEKSGTLYPVQQEDLKFGKLAKNLESSAYGDAYWGTLCASTQNVSQPARVVDKDIHRNLHNAWWKWVSICNSDARRIGEIEAEFGVSIAQLGGFIVDVSVATGMRRFFLSDPQLGLMGLAPRHAKVGDSLAIIQGCSVPFVVRKAVDMNMRAAWRLIGTSYIHGIMDGEAAAVGISEDVVFI